MGVTVYPEIALPAGMIMPYAGAISPEGWLVCDGASLVRSDYPALFAAIGTTYGLGTNTPANTTFALPNLKGKVIVGVDTADADFDVLGEAGGAKTVALVEAQMPPHVHTASVSVTVAGTGTATSWANSRGHTHAAENHKHSYDHWHSANIGNVKAWSGFSHQHVNAGSYAAEGAEQGNTGAGAIPVNVFGTGGVNGEGVGGTSGHGWHSGGQQPESVDHTHRYDHGHTGSGTATIGQTGSGTAHNNLQPYLTMNYLIKT